MDKQIVLITGGSSGIGRATALMLAKRNIHIIINYSTSEERAQSVLTEIEAHGGTGELIRADVSKEDEVKHMFDTIAKAYNKLDYLVNNAGIDDPMPLESYDSTKWIQILQVNLFGKFFCTRYAIPLLKNVSDPRIVNIASRLGEKPEAEAIAYCCAEAAIIMPTKVSALELAKYHIMVNTISPGFTETPMNLNLFPKEKYAEMWENAAKSNPRGRVGSPGDIAQVIAFLLLDNTYINGEEIQITGGSTLV